MSIRVRHAFLSFVLLVVSVAASGAGAGAVDLGAVFNARQVGGFETSDGRALERSS